MSEKKVIMWKLRPLDTKGQWLLCDSEGMLEVMGAIEEQETNWEVKRVGDMTQEEISNLPEFEGW